MSIQEMPVRSDFKAYSFQVDLDGITYILRFRFNTRLDRWIMDIADSSDNDILNGLVVLTNVPLTDQYLSDPNMPQGRFIVIDETGNNKEAGSNDLGNDIKVLYEEVS